MSKKDDDLVMSLSAQLRERANEDDVIRDIVELIDVEKWDEHDSFTIVAREWGTKKHRRFRVTVTEVKP